MTLISRQHTSIPRTVHSCVINNPGPLPTQSQYRWRNLGRWVVVQFTSPSSLCETMRSPSLLTSRSPSLNVPLCVLPPPRPKPQPPRKPNRSARPHDATHPRKKERRRKQEGKGGLEVTGICRWWTRGRGGRACPASSSDGVAGALPSWARGGDAEGRAEGPPSGGFRRCCVLVVVGSLRPPPSPLCFIWN